MIFSEAAKRPRVKCVGARRQARLVHAQAGLEIRALAVGAPAALAVVVFAVRAAHVGLATSLDTRAFLEARPGAAVVSRVALAAGGALAVAQPAAIDAALRSVGNGVEAAVVGV